MKKESWLDPFEIKDIVKLIKKRCPKASNICVAEIHDEEEKKKVIANYIHESNGVTYVLGMELSECGEFLSLDPRSDETFFKMARRKNSGRTINGETFEQAYVRTRTEAISEQREKQIKEAKKEKDFEKRYNKIYHAEKLYNELISSVASFIEKQSIELVEERESNC